MRRVCDLEDFRQPSQVIRSAAVSGALPGLSQETAELLLFHWHTWGWDVVPLLLCAPAFFRVVRTDWGY